MEFIRKYLHIYEIKEYLNRLASYIMVYMSIFYFILFFFKPLPFILESTLHIGSKAEEW